MEIRLRDYQVDMVDRLRLALKRHRRVLLQAPTGSGKTAIASFIAKQTASNRSRLYFGCHRAELVRGTSNTFRKYDIPHGFIAAKWPQAPFAGVQVCSIDTLRNRLATTPEPDVMLWDECHHLGADGWRLIMDTWRRCRHIGLSATPWRLDGTGLDDVFDDMVLGPSTAWLIERGFLSRFEIYAPPCPDMTGVRRRGNDFNAKDASERLDIPRRTGDILAHWRRFANDMRTIGFALSVPDSMAIVERFKGAGIPAEHLDGTTDKTVRHNVISAFADGAIKYLGNVALFDEGFDLASIAQRDDVTVDCLVDAGPTQSLSRVLQRWGRVLRPKDHPAVILDHAGNTLRHGFPDDERQWSLQGREKSGKGGSDDDVDPPFICSCFRAIPRPLPAVCPYCQKSLSAKIRAIAEAKAEGELQRLTADDIAEQRARRKREEYEAQTLQELVLLAQRRGYAHPQQWAFKKFAGSKTRQRAAEKKQEEIAG